MTDGKIEQLQLEKLKLEIIILKQTIEINDFQLKQISSAMGGITQARIITGGKK